MIAPSAAAGGLFAAIGRHVADIFQEVTEARLTGPRAAVCTRTALSVVLAVTLAQWASLDNIWWAAISGLMGSQATSPASFRRSIVRVISTAAGAAIACLAMALFAYDHVALSLFLLATGTVGVLGMSVSAHGYAWLFGALTANIIVMLGMNDPGRTPDFAFYRLQEVTVGCFAAVVMAIMLAPPDDAAPTTAPAAPGWTDLLGARWPTVQHAIRAGVSVMILPVVWNAFDLPSLTQMAVTVAAVMAVPVPTGDVAAAGRAITGRAELRMLGCLCGGAIGLLCLALPLTLYPVWLAALFAGVWICAHVGASERGIAYAGIQASVVFIMTMVQGPGPPTSILPGVERLAGMAGGILVLLAVNLILWPAAAADTPSA